jgi:hypothetical protein
LNHELHHLAQYQKYDNSPWKFGWHYLDSFCKARNYRQNEFEVEAYDKSATGNPLYYKGQNIFDCWREKGGQSSYGFPVNLDPATFDGTQLYFESGKYLTDKSCSFHASVAHAANVRFKGQYKP